MGKKSEVSAASPLKTYFSSLCGYRLIKKQGKSHHNDISNTSFYDVCLMRWTSVSLTEKTLLKFFNFGAKMGQKTRQLLISRWHRLELPPTLLVTPVLFLLCRGKMSAVKKTKRRLWLRLWKPPTQSTRSQSTIYPVTWFTLNSSLFLCTTEHVQLR